VRSCTGKESRRLLCASRPLQGSEKAYRPHPGPSSNPARPLSAHHHHSPPPTPAPPPTPSSVELPGQRELPLLLLPQCLLSPASRWTPRATLSLAQPIRAAARYWPAHPGAVLALPLSPLAASQLALAIPPGPPSLHSRARPAPTKITTLYPPRAPRPPTSSPPLSRSPPYCGETSRGPTRDLAHSCSTQSLCSNVGRPPLARTAKGLPPHPGD
jgi:hypothetical protein